MVYDTHSNLAYSTVQATSGIIGSGSGTTVLLATGDGVKFSFPQNVVVWPSGIPALHNNAEIMRVTNISTDTLTVVRAQEGTSALTNITAGYQISNAITAKVLIDIENSIIPMAVILG